MRNQAKYHNSNWFVFPPLPPSPTRKTFYSPPAVLCFLLLIIIVLLFSFSQMNFNRNWTARAFNQNSNQNRSSSKINIHVAFDTVSSTPNEWPALFIRHTHTLVHLQRGQLRRSISATTHSTHPPLFEGVLQNIPIHQRELIAQEYIGYKSLRYISSVHQLADFLCHSSIILRITSANFQNSKFEILNFLSIRDKVPFECCPLPHPARARGQFHSWAHICTYYILCICMCMLYMYL